MVENTANGSLVILYSEVTSISKASFHRVVWERYASVFGLRYALPIIDPIWFSDETIVEAFVAAMADDTDMEYFENVYERLYAEIEASLVLAFREMRLVHAIPKQASFFLATSSSESVALSKMLFPQLEVW